MLEHPKADIATYATEMSDETMDNQQATDKEIGYLAAMLEGEGTIHLSVRKKKATKRSGSNGIDLVLAIANTDVAIIRKCAAIIRKFGIEPYVHCYERKEPWKDCWQVRISKLSHCTKILPFLIPEMVGQKRHKAALILEFLNRRLTRMTHRSNGGPTWYDKEDWDMVRKVYELEGKDLSVKVPRDYTPPAELSPIQ